MQQLRGLVYRWHRRGGCCGRYGYSAGAANTAYAMGAIYATLPTGCVISTTYGTTYYQCGTTWFQPSYGAIGVYYRVVPTP